MAHVLLLFSGQVQCSQYALIPDTVDTADAATARLFLKEGLVSLSVSAALQYLALHEDILYEDRLNLSMIAIYLQFFGLFFLLLHGSFIEYLT